MAEYFRQSSDPAIFRPVEISIDGAAESIPLGEDATLGSVLKQVRETVSQRKRTVLSVELDGEHLPPDRQKELTESPLSGHRRLEVRTLDPFELALETLSSLVEHLNKMEGIHEGAAELLRDGDVAKASQKLRQCFLSWELMVRAVRDLIVLIGARPEDLMHGGITVQRRVEKIHQDLRKFRDAFEVRDDVTAADVAQPCGPEGREKQTQPLSGSP